MPPNQQLRGKLRGNKSIMLIACFSRIVGFSFFTHLTTFQNNDKKNLVLNDHGRLNYGRAQMWKLPRRLGLLSSDSLACLQFFPALRVSWLNKKIAPF